MTTETLKNPSVVALPNPAGIDKAIQQLQTSLQRLPWIQKIFGRAWTLPTTTPDNKVIQEPKVYQGGLEYYPVLPNDALNSYSFFRVGAGRSTVDYQANMNTGGMYVFRDPVDLIVWGNLQKIDPTKDYIFKEELIQAIMNRLNRDANVQVVRVWDDKVEDIYKGYTLQPAHRDLLMFPFMAFRIEMFLSYQFDCAPSWLLQEGKWNDQGVWDDDAVWKD